MKILWFTNTPSNASDEFNSKYFGGGWISSLETLIANTKKYELGVCFFYGGVNYTKIIKEGVAYYGIPLITEKPLKRIICRHLNILDDEKQSLIEKVVEDFKPDLIHIFGTESGYGKLLIHESEKSLINIQGLLNPISEAFFPPSLIKLNNPIKGELTNILRGLTLNHRLRRIKKMAERERIILGHFHYFIGRTEWDRNYVQLFNPGAEYFHCEEMLRFEFYSDTWIKPPKSSAADEIVIGSTISASPYKGLDLIYRVEGLLKNFQKIKWKVFGISERDDFNKSVMKELKITKPKNIEFYGPLNAAELKKQLLTCHLFVHPSYIDNSSNSVCEAMLLGMPVIASSVGGLKTLIKDGETGFLFNPYDVYDLAGIIDHLTKNYEEALNVGLKAREIALKRHSPATITKTMTDIYDQIANMANVTFHA